MKIYKKYLTVYSTMDVSKLNNAEIDLLISIHNTIIQKRIQKFNKKSILYNKTYNNIINPIIDTIITKTKEILDIFNKKNYDLSKYYIEFHQQNCGFEKKGKRIFDWHIDNYGAVNFEVYTVIYYLRKDITIKGGNLEYKLNNKKFIQEIENGQILCFDGDLKHRPEICSGFGCRDSIVVFIKSLP